LEKIVYGGGVRYDSCVKSAPGLKNLWPIDI